MKKIITLIAIIIVSHICLWGAYLSNVPVTITQPNGTIIECFATGDEYYNWVHDKDGYTIIQDPATGYYCYAILDEDELIASEYIVGEVLPKSTNLTPYINISGEKIMEKVNEMLQYMPSEECGVDAKLLPGILKTLNNIVVYIRFADQTEFPAEQNIYTEMFNDITLNANSMRNYFKEATYSNWDIVSHFYPAIKKFPSPPNTILSYQDSHPRAYYCPYDANDNPIGYKPAEKSHRKDTLVYNAIDYMKDQVPLSLNIDYDNNDSLDNVCFIVRGNVTAWNSILWPHKSQMMQDIYINGKRVTSYNFQIETQLQNIETGGVAPLCHEMGHTFGLPDLYQFTTVNAATPVGLWDVMAMPYNRVQHMCAYMKYKYGGWIPSIPSITTSGTYTLQLLAAPLNSTPYSNCYKIPIKGSSQYIVVEYRKQRPNMFEGCLPGSLFGGSGLIVYRINESIKGNPQGIGPGGVLDEVYVFRQNETINTIGDYRNAYFSETTKRTVFSNSSNPHCFYVSYPPATAYDGNIYIKNIRENSDKTLISFDVRFCDDDDIIYSNTSYLPALTNVSNSIKTTNTVIVKSIDNVTFEAGEEVILNSGFEVQLGGTFEINMNECGDK